ncbi:MAG: type II toxin-antitoxin system RelE/ParE family toxin [Oscillospiraceae bacterium]|nr:type II toxin-antitoxin system RelE/ParE family toxin [Oscillospiraceae bacterium]
MAYRVERTAQADGQLWDIVLYWVGVRGSVDAGLKLLDSIEAEIRQLADFPDCGAPPRYDALRERGYRVLILAKRYLAFYKVDHERRVVTIHTIVDGRQDYLNLI